MNHPNIVNLVDVFDHPRHLCVSVASHARGRRGVSHLPATFTAQSSPAWVCTPSSTCAYSMRARIQAGVRHACTHAYSIRACAPTRVPSRPHTHARTHAHTRARTHTHSHARTDTHTHTRAWRRRRSGRYLVTDLARGGELFDRIVERQMYSEVC